MHLGLIHSGWHWERWHCPCSFSRPVQPQLCLLLWFYNYFCTHRRVLAHRSISRNLQRWDLWQSGIILKVRFNGLWEITHFWQMVARLSWYLLSCWNISVAPRASWIFLSPAISIGELWRVQRKTLTCSLTGHCLRDHYVDLSACPLRPFKCRRYLLCMMGNHQSEWSWWGKCMWEWGRQTSVRRWWGGLMVS